MFDRLEKPFLTVETGEGYQPIRLTFDVLKPELLAPALEKLHCIQKNNTPHSWSWYWQAECDTLPFASIDSFRRNADRPLRLATLSLRENKLHINLTSFKRACLAVPFFHRQVSPEVVRIHLADFINKVFAVDERLPHGFVEVFKEEELERILHQREEDYSKVKEQVETASTPEEAYSILSNYTKVEAKKRLPYVERYEFDLKSDDDPEMVFLAFYIFLRGRELVAIKRWFGQTGYTLADASDEIIEQVFGGLDLDIFEK